MLTVRQILTSAGQDFHQDQRVSGLRDLVANPSRDISLTAVSGAYEAQIRVYFVTLISAEIFAQPDIKTLEDVKARAGDFPLDASKVINLRQLLSGFGVNVRFADANNSTAALIGTLGAFGSVPAMPILDIQTGAANFANGTVAAGGLIMGLGVWAEDPFILMGGALVWAYGAGLLMGLGYMQMNTDMPPNPSTVPAKTNQTDDTDVDPDPDETNDLSLPDGISYGDPPNGVNVDSLLEFIGGGALSDIVDNLPLGWDGDSGSALSDIGGDPLNSDGGSDSGWSGGISI